MSRRTERLGSLLMEELATYIQRDLTDPRIMGFPSVTRVKVAEDLSTADVFLTVMGTPGQQSAALNAIRHAGGLMRTKLTKALSIRQVPLLKFHMDEQLKKELEVLNLLAKVEQEKAEMEERAKKQAVIDAEEAARQAAKDAAIEAARAARYAGGSKDPDDAPPAPHAPTASNVPLAPSSPPRPDAPPDSAASSRVREVMNVASPAGQSARDDERQMQREATGALRQEAEENLRRNAAATEPKGAAPGETGPKETIKKEQSDQKKPNP